MIFFRFSITSISKVIKRVSQTYELQRISLENLQCAGHTSNGWKELFFFQELYKVIKTVRISKVIWQRVPVCRASVIKSPTAVRAKGRNPLGELVGN